MYEKPSIILHKNIVDEYKRTKLIEEIQREEDEKNKINNIDMVMISF